MVNVTLAIPEELHAKMRKHSEVIRKTISEKVDHLDMLDRLSAKSKLTKRDVELLAKNIDGEVAKKLGLK